MKYNSVTLSLFDSNSCGVTWNTKNEPTMPTVQISIGDSFNELDYADIPSTYEKYTSYEYPGDNVIEYYVVKASLTNLKAGEKYSYRCYDKTLGKPSEIFTFSAPNQRKNEVRFAHISDSQIDLGLDSAGTGKLFTPTLKAIRQYDFEPDFILHTGDMVEWSKYESFWEDMLNSNREYFAEIPMATMSGNHETTYKNGKNETFKHFHYNLISQDTTLGFYYSFDYGNVRFLMLNTNRLEGEKLTEDQYNWLVNLLQSNPKKWTVAAMHNPMYSVGKYGVVPERNQVCLGLRNQLHELFVSSGVDIVLQAHDHTYSKTFPIGEGGVPLSKTPIEIIDGIKYAVNPGGVIYSMHGVGGNQVRNVDYIDPEIYDFADVSLNNSWAEISVKEDLLTVSIYGFKDNKKTHWASYGIKKT